MFQEIPWWVCSCIKLCFLVVMKSTQTSYSVRNWYRPRHASSSHISHEENIHAIA